MSIQDIKVVGLVATVVGMVVVANADVEPVAPTYTTHNHVGGQTKVMTNMEDWANYIETREVKGPEVSKGLGGISSNQYAMATGFVQSGTNIYQAVATTNGAVALGAFAHAYGLNSVVLASGYAYDRYSVVIGGGESSGYCGVTIGDGVIQTNVKQSVAMCSGGIQSGVTNGVSIGRMADTIHNCSFVWDGTGDPIGGHPFNGYKSKGIGTFCLNPVGGLSGIYFGNYSLGDIIGGNPVHDFGQVSSNISVTTKNTSVYAEISSAEHHPIVVNVVRGDEGMASKFTVSIKNSMLTNRANAVTFVFPENISVYGEGQSSTNGTIMANCLTTFEFTKVGEHVYVVDRTVRHNISGVTAGDYILDGIVGLFDGHENTDLLTHNSETTLWQNLATKLEIPTAETTNFYVSGTSAWRTNDASGKAVYLTIGNGVSWSNDYFYIECSNAFGQQSLRPVMYFLGNSTRNVFTLEICASSDADTRRSTDLQGRTVSGVSGNGILISHYDGKARIGDKLQEGLIGRGIRSTITLVCDGPNNFGRIYQDGIVRGDYDDLNYSNVTYYGYTSGSVKYYSIRIYNRALSQEEVEYNAIIDSQRFTD